MRRTLFVVAAAVVHATHSEASSTITIVGPSSMRAIANEAFERMLQCDVTQSPSLRHADECALLEHDAVELHSIFRRKQVIIPRSYHDSSDSLVFSIVTVDSVADLAAVAPPIAMLNSHWIALIPWSWEQAALSREWMSSFHAVWMLSEANHRMAVEAAYDKLVELSSGASQSSGLAAVERRRRLEASGDKGPAPAFEPPIKSATKDTPQERLPWDDWLQLSTQTQLATLIGFAILSIALHKIVCWALDAAEARLKSATDTATELENMQIKVAGEMEAAQMAVASEAGAAAAGSPTGVTGPMASSPTNSTSSSAMLTSVGAVATSPHHHEPGTSPSKVAEAKVAVRQTYLLAAGITATVLLFLTFVNVVFDRWRWFPLLSKNKEVGTDVFWAFTSAALLLACYLGVAVNEKDADTLMGVRQTEEAKGWMMMFFLVYHWWDVKTPYNLIRVLVSAYVFLTGYGNTVSLGSKPPTLAKYAASFLRINLLVTCVAPAMGQPWMLYYICGLHTFWTGYVYVLHATLGGGAGGKTRVPKAYRYGLALGVNALLWHWPALLNAVFWPLTPLLAYNGSLYEWYFRTKLDCFICLAGCLLAEARGPIMAHMKAHDGWVLTCARFLMGAAALALHATQLLAMPDRRQYNMWHPYTSWLPILAFVLMRNAGSGLRKTYSGVFSTMGRHSLEIYLMQFHVWLGALAKANVTLVPSLRSVSLVGQTVVFFFLAGVAFRACNAANALLTRRPSTAITAMCVSTASLMLSPQLFPM